MSKETLKTFRLIIPGILIFIFAIPFLNPGIKFSEIIDSLSLLETSVYLGIVLFLGVLYHMSNIRGYFLKDSLSQIHENIKNKLLAPFKKKQNIYKYQDKLRHGKVLLDCFYKLIDNNETLKEKAKNVHYNGLIWSSVADTSALSAVAVLLYFCVWIVSTTTAYLIWFLIFFVLHLLSSRILMPVITRKHIEVSNDQLEFIKLHLKDELQAELEKVIKVLGDN